MLFVCLSISTQSEILLEIIYTFIIHKSWNYPMSGRNIMIDILRYKVTLSAVFSEMN